MSIVNVQKDRYTAEPLYQWDVNQVLEIRGLSLPSVPSIHFTNEAMDRAIVRQATMDGAGVVTVDIPNSLLQKPYKIKAYVCIYEGETFETLYKIEIPVNARKKPADYTIEDDQEVYSFNELENYVYNTVANATSAVNDRCNEVEEKCDEVEEKCNEAVNACNNIASNVDKKIEESIAVESKDYPGCFYRTVNGKIEWINPPMIERVEYRTTERRYGSPIYVMQISLETAPKDSRAEYALFQSYDDQAYAVLEVNGGLLATADSGSPGGFIPFPAIDLTGNIYATAEICIVNDQDTDTNDWYVVVNSLDLSAENKMAHITIKYTKSEV